MPPVDDAEADPFCLSASSYSADGDSDTTSPTEDAGPYSFSIHTSAADAPRGHHPGRKSKSAASSKPTSAATSTTPEPSSIHSTLSTAGAAPLQDAVKSPPSSQPRAPILPPDIVREFLPVTPRGVRPLRPPRDASKPCPAAPSAPLTPTAPLVIRKRKPVPSRAATPPAHSASASSEATAERRASQRDDLIALVDAAITTGTLDAFAALGPAPHVGAFGSGRGGSLVVVPGSQAPAQAHAGGVDAGPHSPRKTQEPICELDLGEMGAAPRAKARLDLGRDESGAGGDVMQCYGLAF